LWCNKQDEKKLADSDVNPSSSSCTVNFANTNPQISGTSVGGMTMPSISLADEPLSHPNHH
jgi:hypothetical protein